MAGYSGTPLAKKLGIKDGFRVWLVNAPENFDQDLDLPADIRVTSSKAKPLDLVLLSQNQKRSWARSFQLWLESFLPTECCGSVGRRKLQGLRPTSTKT
jgi:hypothetical protein